MIIIVIFIVLIILINLYFWFLPTIDWIKVGEKRVRIMWYYNLKRERKWVFI